MMKKENMITFLTKTEFETVFCTVSTLLLPNFLTEKDTHVGVHHLLKPLAWHLMAPTCAKPKSTNNPNIAHGIIIMLAS